MKSERKIQDRNITQKKSIDRRQMCDFPVRNFPVEESLPGCSSFWHGVQNTGRHDRLLWENRTVRCHQLLPAGRFGLAPGPGAVDD